MLALSSGRVESLTKKKKRQYGLGIRLDQRCKRYKQCNILPEKLPKFGECSLILVQRLSEYPCLNDAWEPFYQIQDQRVDDIQHAHCTNLSSSAQELFFRAVLV